MKEENYIRFDWAIKRLLRICSNRGIQKNELVKALEKVNENSNPILLIATLK